MIDVTPDDDGSPALNTTDATVPGTTDYSDSMFGRAMGYAIGATFGAVPQNRGDGWRAARGAKTQPR